MPRKFWVSHNAHPLDHLYAARYHETSQKLPCVDRFFSYTAGGRDTGVLEIAANGSFVAKTEGAEDKSSLPTTRWLTRNMNTCLEAIEREYLDGESRTARLAHDLDQALHNIFRLKVDLLDLQVERSRVAGEPKPQLSTINRSIAEKHVDDAIVVGRRQKVWDTQLAGVDARVGSTTAAIGRLEEQAAGLDALVQKAFFIAATRARGTHAWYERRASVYLRGLIRRHPQGSQLQALLGSTDTIPTPAWISKPCPWIPQPYLSAIPVPSATTPNK